MKKKNVHLPKTEGKHVQREFGNNVSLSSRFLEFVVEGIKQLLRITTVIIMKENR